MAEPPKVKFQSPPLRDDYNENTHFTIMSELFWKRWVKAVKDGEVFNLSKLNNPDFIPGDQFDEIAFFIGNLCIQLPRELEQILSTALGIELARIINHNLASFEKLLELQIQHGNPHKRGIESFLQRLRMKVSPVVKRVVERNPDYFEY